MSIIAAARYSAPHQPRYERLGLEVRRAFGEASSHVLLRGRRRSLGFDLRTFFGCQAARACVRKREARVVVRAASCERDRVSAMEYRRPCVTLAPERMCQCEHRGVILS